eukprot:2607764-Alexandrium_andersonii.AAC.1
MAAAATAALLAGRPSKAKTRNDAWCRVAASHLRCSAEASGSVARLHGVPYAPARRAIVTAGHRRRRCSADCSPHPHRGQ